MASELVSIAYRGRLLVADMNGEIDADAIFVDSAPSSSWTSSSVVVSSLAIHTPLSIFLLNLRLARTASLAIHGGWLGLFSHQVL